MIDSIHKEFIRMLESTPWMDSVTRNAAIEKAKAMNFFIGCPNELMENAKLDEYYRNLELQPDSLLHSMLRIRKFNKIRQINEFRQPIEKSDWRTLSLEATMVNAFYSPQLNIISKLSISFEIGNCHQIFKLTYLCCVYRIDSWHSSKSLLFKSTVSSIKRQKLRPKDLICVFFFSLIDYLVRFI